MTILFIYYLKLSSPYLANNIYFKHSEVQVLQDIKHITEYIYYITNLNASIFISSSMKIINIEVAPWKCYCGFLSTDEVHKAPGDPQDKLALLKIIKTTKRKYQETFWKLPENLDSKEKSHLLELLDFWTKNTMQKESLHLDLYNKSYAFLNAPGI